MRFWWVTLVLLLAGIVVWALTFLYRRPPRRRPVLVANSEFLERLPSFVRSRRLARILRVLAVGTAVCGLLSSAVLSGRIATERVQSPEFANRDIVLCLDVSGSMYKYDTQILRTFAEMVDSFQGERIGLSIFNSTSRTVFPLTNDYDLVRRQLEEGAEAVDFDEFGYRSGAVQYPQDKVRRYTEFVAGTRGVDEQASIVPDGLASCAQEFDRAEEDRSRSIILATDNEVNGEPIYTLAQAAQTVQDRGVDLYTIYPGAFECGPQCFEELERETRAHGGEVFASDDPNAMPRIIAQIERTQAQVMGAAPTVVRTDRPMFGAVLTLLSLIAVLLVGWRSRE
ncbi:vWA domain-containing protein [Brachybacterium sillae]|uniref:vWA domain-containing protein n=1 Tax=Brachybacterium sillae TaxID=2810536 RepID=UPI00217EC5F2|nr:VWA domain-containing protein [Brachybacterium sillae]